MNSYLASIFTGILTAVIFFVAGVICLFFPYKIQKIALKKPAFNLGKYNPFLPFMKTKGYIWMLRIIGIFSLLICLFIILVMIKGFIIGH